MVLPSISGSSRPNDRIPSHSNSSPPPPQVPLITEVEMALVSSSDRSLPDLSHDQQSRSVSSISTPLTSPPVPAVINVSIPSMRNSISVRPYRTRNGQRGRESRPKPARSTPPVRLTIPGSVSSPQSSSHQPSHVPGERQQQRNQNSQRWGRSAPSYRAHRNRNSTQGQGQGQGSMNRNRQGDPNNRFSPNSHFNHQNNNNYPDAFQQVNHIPSTSLVFTSEFYNGAHGPTILPSQHSSPFSSSQHPPSGDIFGIERAQIFQVSTPQPQPQYPPPMAEYNLDYQRWQSENFTEVTSHPPPNTFGNMLAPSLDPPQAPNTTVGPIICPERYPPDNSYSTMYSDYNHHHQYQQPHLSGSSAALVSSREQRFPLSTPSLPHPRPSKRDDGVKVANGRVVYPVHDNGMVYYIESTDPDLEDILEGRIPAREIYSRNERSASSN